MLRSICVAAKIRVCPRIRGLPDVDGSLAPHTRPQILNAAVLGSIRETTYSEREQTVRSSRRRMAGTGRTVSSPALKRVEGGERQGPEPVRTIGARLRLQGLGRLGLMGGTVPHGARTMITTSGIIATTTATRATWRGS